MGMLGTMLAPYRRLLALPAAGRLVLASASARLAIGAFTLPFILTVEEATGSFAAAGLATAAFSLGVTVAAPVRGRTVDRYGSDRALPVMAALSATSLLAIAALAGSAPRWSLVVLAASAGVSTPPLVASMRLEWQRILGVGDVRLAQAYAFDSALQTGVFVVGPLLAAIGIAAAGARVTLAASAAALLLGTLVFAGRTSARSPDDSHRQPSPIRRPAVLTLVAALALTDIALGAIDVVVPAFAEGRDRPALAGVLLAAWAAGAVVGALSYGARSWPAPPAAQLVVLALTAAMTVAVLAVADSFLVLGAVLLIAGAPGAAYWAASSIALDRASGGSAGAEAYTWLSAANGVGIAIGSALAGAVVERWGAPTAFLMAAVAPAAAAALLAVRHRTLSTAAQIS